MTDKRKYSLLVLLYVIGITSIFLILAHYFPISDITDIGQLFADWLLFPTVIIGFWITITEFRKSQVVPDVKLLWKGDMTIDSEDGCFVFRISEHDVKTFFLQLFVKNEGSTIATWYRLAFDIPRQLAKPLSESHEVRWHIGDESCWNSSFNTQDTHHEFKSNGQYALYPDEGEIHIATIEIQMFPQLSYPNRMYLRHSVVTDKTHIQRGMCKLKIRKEDFIHDVV